MSDPSLSATLEIYNRWRYVVENALGTEIPDAGTYLYQHTLTDGTGSELADRRGLFQRTVAVSANDDIDLAGSLVDIFGNTLTFVKIRKILIANLSETAGEKLILDSSVANSFLSMFNANATSRHRIDPLGVFLNYSPIDGFAVVATTADILRITNGGVGSITYNLEIIGTTA